MSINFEKLAQLQALQGLNPAELKAFFQIATKVEVKVGDYLLRTGEKADCFYLVAVGRFEIRIPQEGGSQAVAQSGFGQLIGEMSLVHATPTRHADAIAMEDSVLLRFSYAAFKILASEQPELGQKIRTNLFRVAESRKAPPSAARPNVAGITGSERTFMRMAAIFAGLSEDEFEALAAIAKPGSARAGQLLVEHGSLSDAFFLIVAGSCQVQIPKVGGALPVARLSAGQVFGEMALVYRQKTRTADVLALEDTAFLVFTFADFEHLQGNWPGIPRRIKQNLGRVAAGRAWTMSGDMGEILREESGSSRS